MAATPVAQLATACAWPVMVFRCTVPLMPLTAVQLVEFRPPNSTPMPEPCVLAARLAVPSGCQPMALSSSVNDVLLAPTSTPTLPPVSDRLRSVAPGLAPMVSTGTVLSEPPVDWLSSSSGRASAGMLP